MDFKIPVYSQLLDDLTLEYAPPDHPVFQLTPPVFDECAQAIYHDIGQPPVNANNLWTVYHHVLAAFRPQPNMFLFSDKLRAALDDHEETMEELTVEQNTFALLPGLKQMREGGVVLNIEHVGTRLDAAEFTSSDESESDNP
ncbi:hypothetical protein H0H92_007103 [Tricholoma furcatifolium]|nr:hypothetical protein H0H92_007103 [Tricholoma furcatifolium]